MNGRTCSGERIPEVELTYTKRTCLMKGSEKLLNAEAIANFVQRNWGCMAQELVLAIHFDIHMQVINFQRISTGSASVSLVDPKVVFNGAIAANAASFCLVHTHPSGVATPSAADEHLTTRLIEGARILDLKIVDHVIVARGGGYYSFAANGTRFSEFATYGGPSNVVPAGPSPEDFEGTALVMDGPCPWPRRR